MSTPTTLAAPVGLPAAPTSADQQFAHLNEHELRRLLIEQSTRQKLGLNWEHNAIDRDKAINSNVVLPRLVESLSCGQGADSYQNLIIEGDNFDSLRLLRATHANKIRVIYIDPPYNTGNQDWVYNDRIVGKEDQWKHSQWLEFLHQRLTLARDLLTPDGVILVSINDENRSKLELLMDEVFPGRRIGSFVWRVRSGGNDTKGTLLSENHEHILVYANRGFQFKGEGRDESAYGNADNDPRGEWGNDNLVKAHNAKQRPEAYYSIRNPQTGIWYLCDPDSVWRFSSTTRPLKKKLQADPIETIIRENRVLWPQNVKTVIYPSARAILAAIKDGSAPKQLKIYSQLKELAKLALNNEKIARLLTYIEPIESWIGREIGYGKPRYKRFRDQLKRDVTPLSSWLNAAAEKAVDDEDDDETVILTVGATGEGSSLVKKILGNKDFPYPKPLSLLKGLLSQATRRNDIVLDFFGGSGTTAHAVLELNKEDGGERRFILCSNTEKNSQEPNQNICRDICAERVRRVIESNEAFAESGFAYLQLDKMEPADMRLDASIDNSLQLLGMRFAQGALPASEGLLNIVRSDDDLAVVYLTEVNTTSLASLQALPQPRLAVYSTRPQTVAEHLEHSGKVGNCYSIGDALALGQTGTAA